MKQINSLLLDCGRKYFSLSDIKQIVCKMAENGFNVLILAFGNDGFRFFLDDMSITMFGYTYSSEQIKENIHQANLEYYDAGIKNELSQSEMEELFDYCNDKQIEIIPLLNTPGHMNAVLKGMELLDFKNIRYKNSKTTIDLDNHTALEFLTEFLTKYILWFKKKGCRYFHLGCDEYANDVLQSGFTSLQSPENYKYDNFVNYVNAISKIVESNGMTPLIFNDGMYYGNHKKDEMFNKSLIVSYWTKGWEGYTLADAQEIIKNGHSILNTNCKWYYVLGRYNIDSEDMDFTYRKSMEGMDVYKSNDIYGCGTQDCIGVTFCIWCDNPTVPYDDIEKANIASLIHCFGRNVI